MSERIFIGVAWPYANGSLHLGQIAGAYLPADIFARYHRTKGNEVLMVSGSDQHGTPITIKAEQEGKTPKEIADFYYRELPLSPRIFFSLSRKMVISTGIPYPSRFALSASAFCPTATLRAPVLIAKLPEHGATNATLVASQ
jgi:hypothetical protein